MAEKTTNLQECNDLIQRCNSLSKQNITKYHNFIKLQEVLRLEFIGTNDDYKFLKTWLNTAYEDILISKSEHCSLIQHYKILLKNNIITEFLNFANDQEILQLKFIEKIHECKDFKADIDTSEEYTKILKSEYNDLSQHTRGFRKRSEALRLNLTECIDECERIKKSLDVAHESIIELNSEHDDLMRRFRVLFEKKVVKEFLDCAKYQEKLEQKYIQNPAERKCPQSCQSQTNEEVISLNMKLAEIREMISKERSLNEQAEKQRDSLDYLSAKLCLLLLKYQRLTASDEMREQYSMIDRAVQKSVNVEKTSESSNTIIEFDSSDTLNISITEWKIDKKEINDENFNEIDNELKMMKNEKETANCELNLSFSDGDEYSNHNSNEKSSNTRKKRDLIPEEKISSRSELPDDVQKSQYSRTNVSNSPLATFLCDKCGKGFKTKCTGQEIKICPVCNEHSKSRIHEKPLSKSNTNDQIPEAIAFESRKKEISRFRCDICSREYSSINLLKQHNCIVRERQKKKRFRCNQCDETFDRKDVMQRHVSRIHNRDVNYYDCAYCAKRYTSGKSILEYHIYTKHSENFDKPYKCTICDASFAIKFLLTRHKEEKHDSAEISGLRCDICDKHFLRKSSLKQHNFNVHRKKRFSCPVCGKAFNKLRYLKDHSVMHNSVKLFKCSTCDRRFTFDSSRRYHEKRVHSISAPCYLCEHCNKQYFLKHQLRLHIHTRHFSGVNKPFKCSLCDKAFRTKAHLKEHQSAHSTEQPFKCSTCDRRFNRLGNKRRHERTVHNEELPFCCAHCDKRCGDKMSLSDHIHRSHFSGLSKTFKCTICNKAFAKSYVLKDHVKRVHLLERPFKCSWCDKYFKCASHKRRHENTFHKRTVWFNCLQCDKRFLDKDYLTRHIRSNHSTEPVKKPFECSICKKKFALKCYLESHKSTHSSERPHKCSFCDKHYKTVRDKRSHERMFHDENFIHFECAHCGKLFRRKDDVSDHILAIHLSKNGKQFKCTICKKAFACKRYLKVHQSSHSSEKTFKCPKCDMCFKTSRGKSCHVLAIHEDARFKCTSCDKMYNYKQDLSKHIRDNHS